MNTIELVKEAERKAEERKGAARDDAERLLTAAEETARCEADSVLAAAREAADETLETARRQVSAHTALAQEERDRQNAVLADLAATNQQRAAALVVSFL